MLTVLWLTESVASIIREQDKSFFGTLNLLHYMLFCAMQKRLAKEARALELQAKNAALGKKVKEPSATKGARGRGEASFYRVTCKV